MQMLDQDDAHDRLGAAVRALADAVVRSGADAQTLARAAEDIERLSAALAAAPQHERLHDSPYHAMSAVGGTAHPTAPQLHTTPIDGGVGGIVVLGPAYEGGPGLAHGGILSLLLDHAMGQAMYTAGHAGMTASLEVRYLAPTPLGVPLSVTARVDRNVGRRVHVVAQIVAAETTTVEARGMFITLTRDAVARIFPRERIPEA